VSAALWSDVMARLSAVHVQIPFFDYGAKKADVARAEATDAYVQALRHAIRAEIDAVLCERAARATK
jgi:hypothetical protein